MAFGNPFARQKDIPIIGHRKLDGSVDINGLVVKRNGFIVGVPKNIHERHDSVTTGATPTLLHGLQIPIGTLVNAGDFIDAKFTFLFSSDDLDKTIQISLDVDIINNSGALDQDSGSSDYLIRLIRLDATHVRAIVHQLWNFLVVNGASTIVLGNGLFSTNAIDVEIPNLDSNILAFNSFGDGGVGAVTQIYSQMYATQIA